MIRTALAALAGLALSSAAPPPVVSTDAALPSPYLMDLSLVEYITCAAPAGEPGSLVGSGVRIDGDLILTAAHVVSGGACVVGGVLTPPEPAEAVVVDGGLDYAVLRVPTRRSLRIEISCAGYRPGQVYIGFGYPGGNEFVAQRYVATNGRIGNGSRRGMAILRGTSIGGMSGGPLVDSEGRVVGIVNAGTEGRPILVSRELRQTYLCGAPA